jgi:glycosyltransferase involved in cell wall biosynthesis
MPKANHGVSHARNRGFKISAGKHIAFLDCGDELTPD